MEKKIAVVYFSKDGSTEQLAKVLQKRKDADVIRLIEANPKGNLFTRGWRASKRKGCKLIGTPEVEADRYESLILCTPIWAFNGTPAMMEFIKNSDFKGKDIDIVTVKGYPDSVEKIHKYLKELVESKNGAVKNCFDVTGAGIGKTASLEDVEKQVSTLDI